MKKIFPTRGSRKHIIRIEPVDYGTPCPFIKGRRVGNNDVCVNCAYHRYIYDDVPANFCSAPMYEREHLERTAKLLGLKLV